MAKKSSSGHHKPMPAHGKGAARKPQAPERMSTATLVRSPDAPTPSAANIVAEPQPAAPKAQPAQPAPAAAKSASAPAAAKAPAKPAATPKPAARPAPSAATPAAKPATASSREQNQRIARARAVQRARQANLISAESYSYVLGDLKLVVALAVSAFVVLSALTFVLPH